MVLVAGRVAVAGPWCPLRDGPTPSLLVTSRCRWTSGECGGPCCFALVVTARPWLGCFDCDPKVAFWARPGECRAWGLGTWWWADCRERKTRQFSHKFSSRARPGGQTPCPESLTKQLSAPDAVYTEHMSRVFTSFTSGDVPPGTSPTTGADLQEVCLG